ncbi:zinc ABC transporter substrate-binding protein ZnuA [Vibrio panuliri]|uniref:High-affinity zinc uptake system protein ZnuA n=1 Tax=Vibrio panuliri TaxID=1381081 RepID=A0ABX3FTV0_9VIBR|nr:zinc ABC transporter substrate-binding protein ZnuA [Vibrio panuliri]KAB1454977.1 zinc ABC transporter substrate-binding protein ZnuA [Vibrio panuliri]OLQ96358.1 zinc ABC transporter substrate-binding protein [Vibrio panuliri]
MKTKFAVLTAPLLAFVCSTAAAEQPQVLTSIKPIQMIAHEIMLGTGEPDVLLQSNASPHDYAMKPSDVKKVKNADLVIWFGTGLEPFLAGVLEQKEQVLELSKISGLSLREFSHDGHDHHDHDGHDHGSHDPHFWLGYQPTLQVAHSIANELSRLDQANAQQYQANYDKFAQRYKEKRQQIDALLTPVKQQGYYVFHDAYGYFEQDYQLNHLGHFTVTPDRKPGAKTLIKIRNELRNENAKCVFAEPQFTPAVVQSVMRGSDAKLGELDPVASTISVQDGSYFVFLDQISHSFAECLSK